MHFLIELTRSETQAVNVAFDVGSSRPFPMTITVTSSTPQMITSKYTKSNTQAHSYEDVNYCIYSFMGIVGIREDSNTSS